MTLPTLRGLMVYPIKSAGGIPVTGWEVDDFGLRYDRRWMVTDVQGRFVTQRTDPRLALARPELLAGLLRVTAPDLPPLELPSDPQDRPDGMAAVWRDVCRVQDAGGAAARWFSRLLGRACRLVHMPPGTVRTADPTWAPDGVRVSFADAFPFLLLSEESLADLNGRLATPVPMNRFRPNLVIGGGSPFQEDRLGAFRLGPIELLVRRAGPGTSPAPTDGVV